MTGITVKKVFEDVAKKEKSCMNTPRIVLLMIYTRTKSFEPTVGLQSEERHLAKKPTTTNN